MLVHLVLGDVAVVEFLDESDQSLAEKFVAYGDCFARSAYVFKDGYLLDKENILEQGVYGFFLNVQSGINVFVDNRFSERSNQVCFAVQHMKLLFILRASRQGHLRTH